MIVTNYRRTCSRACKCLWDSTFSRDGMARGVCPAIKNRLFRLICRPDDNEKTVRSGNFGVQLRWPRPASMEKKYLPSNDSRGWVDLTKTTRTDKTDTIRKVRINFDWSKKKVLSLVNWKNFVSNIHMVDTFKMIVLAQGQVGLKFIFV